MAFSLFRFLISKTFLLCIAILKKVAVAIYNTNTLLLANNTSNFMCAACKSQRRRCPSDCIFSPYFPANDPQKFACVHKIYGGSNIGKMLQQIPPYAREQAADTLYLEAQCRIQDPVYGCVGIISKLYQQIHDTEIELAKIQTQIAFHKIQIPQVEVESNFNILSKIEAESNLGVLPAQSSMGQFQFDHSSQAPNWFN